jgi:hypothetical protein
MSKSSPALTWYKATSPHKSKELCPDVHTCMKDKEYEGKCHDCPYHKRKIDNAQQVEAGASVGRRPHSNT